MTLRYDTVTLLSDFGASDGTVGVVHSVIRQMAPGVGIVDLSHGVPRFDVRAGSLTLARSVQFLCPGVIVGMVDPAAGTAQRSVAVEVAGGAAVLVGPDNGLLAPAVGMVGGAERAVVLDRVDRHLPTDATTFLARDVLAPVAAHLCGGVELTDVGTEVDPASLMPGLVPLTSLETDDDGAPVLYAEVLWVDHFGNVQLNVDPDEIAEWGSPLALGAHGVSRTVRRVAGFAELATGELGLLLDADGLIAVVADRHAAADELSLGVGDEVTLAPLDDRVDPSGDGPRGGTRTNVEIGRTRRGEEG